MYQRITRAMQARADLMMQGRLVELAGEYLYPMALYQDERQIIVQDADEFVGMLETLHAEQRALGVARIMVKVVALDMPRQERLRVWLEREYRDAKGGVASRMDMIHYCRLAPVGVKTEMVSYGKGLVTDLWHRLTLPEKNHAALGARA